jgi:hypothetical protein
VFFLSRRDNGFMALKARKAVSFTVVAVALLTAAVLTGSSSSAFAKQKLRTESAFGACVSLPTKLFPKRGLPKEDSTDQKVFEISGPKDRSVTIGTRASYDQLLATEIPGWVTEEIRVDKVKKVSGGYTVTGHWEGGDGQSEAGGPWYRHTIKKKDGSATTVDFFFLEDDFKSNTKMIAASIESVRTCS